MPSLLIFIAYFAIALLSGAAVAYPLHMLLANWFELEFDRVASRSVLIVAIILFITLYRKFGFGSWKEIGYTTNKKQFFNDVAKGIVFGILIMSPVIVGLLLTKNRVFDMGWELTISNTLGLLITALTAGLIIAALEETLFRGAMFSAINKQSSTLFAVAATSLFYALVHFIQPDIKLDASNLNWTSGFALLKNAFSSFADISHIFDSLFALFLAGVLLSIVRIRTNRIAFCIGIHAGWVMAIKVFKRITDSNFHSDYAFLTGSYDKVIGYLAAASITIFILLLLKFLNENKFHS